MAYYLVPYTSIPLIPHYWCCSQIYSSYSTYRSIKMSLNHQRMFILFTIWSLMACVKKLILNTQSISPHSTGNQTLFQTHSQPTQLWSFLHTFQQRITRLIHKLFLQFLIYLHFNGNMPIYMHRFYTLQLGRFQSGNILFPSEDLSR